MTQKKREYATRQHVHCTSKYVIKVIESCLPVVRNDDSDSTLTILFDILPIPIGPFFLNSLAKKQHQTMQPLMVTFLLVQSSSLDLLSPMPTHATNAARICADRFLTSIICISSITIIDCRKGGPCLEAVSERKISEIATLQNAVLWKSCLPKSKRYSLS